MKRVLLLLPLFACASQPLFVDRPIAWAVSDDRSISEPEEREYRRYAYFTDLFLLRRSTRALELNTYQPAGGINALEEVPDSSWFNNRIGVRDVSPEEAVRGVEKNGPPVLPWTVVGGKYSGGNPGFVAKDATGRKFVVKFDRAENPEQQTATDIIVGRLFWTLGYNVPADYISVFSREQITMEPGSKIGKPLEGKVDMTIEDVERILATSPKRMDGKYRAIVSEHLPGKPIGGVSPEGLREDDPNDVIPHEQRRELRAMKVIGAWVNHTDMKEDNTFDVYVEENGKKFVKHYFIDFGEAFAAHGSEQKRMEDGYEHQWDWVAQPLGFFTLGLWVRLWEHLEQTPWPSVGAFTWEHFDPEDWHEAYPYWPIMDSGMEDWFWAAKLIMRVDQPIIERIVQEAQLSVPEAAQHLVTTLVKRRDMIGRTYIEKLTPLDNLEVADGKLCATDLGVKYGFVNQATAALDVIDVDDDVVSTAAVGTDARVCVPAPTGDAYTVVRLQSRRSDDDRPPMQVHMKGGRILGIVRYER